MDPQFKQEQIYRVLIVYLNFGVYLNVIFSKNAQ